MECLEGRYPQRPLCEVFQLLGAWKATSPANGGIGRVSHPAFAYVGMRVKAG